MRSYEKILLLFVCFLPLFPGLNAGETAPAVSGAGKDNGPCRYYIVEALSNLKRTGALPPDGECGGILRIIAAQEEYEAASFVFHPLGDVADVELVPGDLKGRNGSIPASSLELKIVKLWFQTGTAWHSYFADSTGRQLIPELLLKDENLVTVDLEQKENYLRVKEPDGRERRLWISAPAGTYERLDPNRILIADSDTLQPFRMRRNVCTQIWVTFHAPSGAEGIYRGEIAVRIGGRNAGAVPVSVRVLPFRLPAPRTAYELSQPFFAGSYNAVDLARYVRSNGGDAAKAEKRVRAEYESFRRHNLLYPLMPCRSVHTKTEELPFIHRQMELYREAGLGTEALFNAVSGFPAYGDLTKIRKLGDEISMAEMPLAENWAEVVRSESAFVRSLFGKDVPIYCFGWDEPGMWLLRAERRSWKFLHDNGMKVFSTANRNHFLHAGFNEDFVNFGGRITKKETDAWHAAGVKITSYADPHTGIENPDFVRRTHGLYPYLIHSDGSMNYMVCGSDWNDFIGSGSNFRSFNWIYPGTFQPVETIQYEAFREAIDDVRYATLLRQLAEKALHSEKTEHIYKARAALLWLAQLDPETCDLNTVRTEMIRHILELRNLK